MISIKKYIELDHEAVVTATKTAFLSALVAISECSCDACPSAGSTLQTELRKASIRIEQASLPAEMAELGHQVERSIRAWGDSAEDYLQEKASEFKEIMLMMAQTADSMGDRDQRYSADLNQLTTQLQSIAKLDDLTQIRGQLIRSTVQLKLCLARMSSEGQQAIREVRNELTTIHGRAEAAERLAATDVLTGLPNRRTVESELEDRLARRQSFCLLFFDLNQFKQINDRHGHHVGDEVLRHFAAELKSASRSSDTVGRWGGDEFVAITDGCAADVESYLGRIRDWVFGDYSISMPGGGVKIKVSVRAAIGITESRPGDRVAQILRRADAAMYEQKARDHKAAG